MNTQTTIAAETAAEIIEYVPLTDLYLSDLNPRQEVAEDGIALLAESIAACGLIQNLAGLRDETGRVGIVAGGRRLRAINVAVSERPDLAVVPVRMAPSAHVAEEWANAENTAREELDPVDEVRAYATMAEKALSLAKISQAFGVTEAHVRRRLALAKLPCPVLDALKSEAISIGQAKAMTVSEDEKKILEVLERAKSGWFNEYQIKTALKPDAVDGDNRKAKFVGQGAYEAEGGTVTQDLFEDEILFNSPDILDRLFSEKLEGEANTLQDAEGWAWVMISEDSNPFWYEVQREHGFARVYKEEGVLNGDQSARYDALSEQADAGGLDEVGGIEFAELEAIIEGAYSDQQKALAGAMVYVRHDRTLSALRGLIKREDHDAAIAAGVLEASQHETGTPSPAEPKSPISQKLAADLACVATGARQHAALRDPDMILTLLAFQLTGKAGYRRPFGLSASDVPNLPSTEVAGYALDDRLTTPASTPKDPFGSDLARGFRAFKAKGMEHVMAELTRHLAASLTVEDEKLAGLIDKTVSTSIREVWTPTAENFFSRVGAAYLNTLWCDLLDLPEDHATATGFAKLKKGEKAEKLETLFADRTVRSALGLTEEQEAVIAAWLPESMS
ncbi:MAG: ParB/RepB/Spo0J family partition protein [Sedimentitalea sp.]|uniref:ParB/RepB/Spo0J family partition protein n=1 Tax=Sedimentitalea sp. TaxID=2048915 RepID=UPI0032643750